VHRVVVVQVVAQLVAELGEQAVLDELGGAGVDACFGLRGCVSAGGWEREGRDKAGSKEGGRQYLAA
jgi:hypothetical protein